MNSTMTVANASEKLLELLGKPLHYKEITDLIIKDCRLNGKTPYHTVRSELGTNPKFIRVAEGIYALSKWADFKPARFAKDIAYEILKSHGIPMSPKDLGKKILEERTFKDSLRSIIRNVLARDPRFKINWDENLVYLVEWNKK